MQHISMQGFKTIPAVPVKLTAKSKIQLRSEHSLILWQQSLTTKSTTYFCFGGVLVEGTKSSGLLKLVKALNSGASCLVSDYLKGSASDLQDLQALAEAGAFSKGT
jgi:hypothetical protein